MKNEIGDSEIIEAVSVKSKVYSFITKKDKQKEEKLKEKKLKGEEQEDDEQKDDNPHKKLKGIKSYVVENDIKITKIVHKKEK